MKNILRKSSLKRVVTLNTEIQNQKKPRTVTQDENEFPNPHVYG